MPEKINPDIFLIAVFLFDRNIDSKFIEYIPNTNTTI